MRRLLTLLAVLLVLPVCAAAYEIPADFSGRTLEDVVTEFRQVYGLTEDNFSISYYNTVTEESYAFNDTGFFIGASTYKLPLNLYFYEMEQAGEIAADTYITWTGRTLADIHEQSIVYSNNELSEALMYYWGDHAVYKENLRKYFTMADEEISPLYWQGNWFCTRMMMDCLKYLYANQTQFGELIGYMKQAMPGQYFKRGVTDYEVAHKYGSIDGYNNDVGIIYTPQPFLLAVYTGMGAVGDDGICAEAAGLMTAYAVWQSEQQTPAEEAEEEQPVEEPEEVEPAVQELPIVTEEAPAAEAPPAVMEAPSAAVPVVPEAAVRRKPMALPLLGALAVLLLLLRLLRRKR